MHKPFDSLPEKTNYLFVKVFSRRYCWQGLKVNKNLPLLFVPLLLLLVGFTIGDAQAENPPSAAGTVSGIIIAPDHPQTQWVVSFFLKQPGKPPAIDCLRRLPDFSTLTDDHGRFLAKLQEGEYFLGVRDRGAKELQDAFPPNDTVYYAGATPSQLLTLRVTGQQDLDVGRIEAYPAANFAGENDFFAISGRVVNESGKPMAGVRVMGKSRLNQRQPEFVSRPTDAEGNYHLQLPAGRPYYLVAREDLATARPQRGSYFGTYGIRSKTGLITLPLFSTCAPLPGTLAQNEESRAHPVYGRKGQAFSGVDIDMFRVPDPDLVKDSIQDSRQYADPGEGVQITNILFAPKSSDLDEASLQELDRWLDFMVGQDDLTFEVIGHTDNVGSAAANQLLSENRAMSVAAYLISSGVAPDRLKVLGKGGSEPVADNQTPEGRARNRRVEIRFLDPDD